MPGLSRPHPTKKGSFSNVNLYAGNEDDASIPPFNLRKISSVLNKDWKSWNFTSQEEIYQNS